MKKSKRRFGLLAKIILLTGVLTILTVSTSFVVTSIISYISTKASYVNSCEIATDNIEGIFALEDEKTIEILDVVIEKYSAVKEQYDSFTDEERAAYQKDLSVSLFGPKDGSFGMTQDKAIRKAFYSEVVGKTEYTCSSYKVPFASFFLFDTQGQNFIQLLNSNVEVEKNLDLIGLKVNEVKQEELDFFNSGNNYITFKTINDLNTYNLVEFELPLADTNFKCFVQAQYPLAEFNQSFNRQLTTELIITGASTVFLVVIYAILTKLFMLSNVDRLIKSSDKFVGMMKNDEKLEVVDSNVKSSDEIRELSDSFMIMQESIITYVDNIKKAKDTENAFKAEVDIASRIQLESLPAPTYFHDNIELRAYINPAKGVGGDFYDYFYVDKDHLAVVIADVSGKGIPASLFMMRSKESIRSACQTEANLAKVLFKVNNELCLNNKEGFFVTVFLGVLNLKNYTFDFISAGHERPYIKHGKKCERLECESNFVLGLEEDFEFIQQQIKLKVDDSIMLYTDGLNEAINSNKEEFGYQRIQESLQKDPDIKQNIVTLIADLETFRGEEAQFDDITLLSVKIKKDVTTYSYFNPTYNEIDDLTDKTNALLKGLDKNLLGKIDVVIDEVMNNIISYGKTKTNKTLSVSIEKTKDGVTFVFVDNSHPFNPLLKEKRTVQENMDEGIVGGLGISIVKSISKETEYEYSNNKNILLIKF